ncbi:FHA domain-containing protein [Serinibacter arcticus]|uniref:FHA domain containing protein n=1 Tax=Serinibacter arcticus TaxID=1655435 RepID=A0A4Z1DZE4_9MICO|nr:FHA domain-containing protein [Serinibacter arcticus]TGO04380.1 FHA domain containing protein [Serinibacter arcticus]
MGYDGVDDWSIYTPGPDSAVITSTTLALLDSAVPADVVERVWDAARQGGGLAAVVAPLVGSLADLPTFAVVVIDGGRPRALVRGELEVVVGDTVVSGQGVATWREETLATGEGDAHVEVTVRRLDHAEAPDSTPLPVLAGVVRASRATGRLELRPSNAVADGSTPAVSDASDASEVGSESADPDPVVPIPLPVPVDGDEAAFDEAALGKAPADEAAPDEAAVGEAPADEAEGEDLADDGIEVHDVAEENEPFVASGESDDSGASAESLVGLENDGSPHTDDAVERRSEDPVVDELAEHDLDEPTVAPALDGVALPEEDASGVDADPDTEPLLDRESLQDVPLDPPLDQTLHPGGEDSSYGFVSEGGSSVVPARPGQVPPPPAAPELADVDPSLDQPQAQEPPASPAPVDPFPTPEPVAPAPVPAESAPAEPAPIEPPPIEPAPADDVDGDHDGGTILDHQVAGLRDAGLVTVSPWSRPAAEPAAPGLHLSFSHGVEVQLDRPVLVGRAPEARPGVDAQLVAVPSPQQDISRTHCEIRLDGEDVLVTDLRSTNGTIVSRPGQAPHRLHPGEGTSASAGSRIDLGDGVVIVVEL